MIWKNFSITKGKFGLIFNDSRFNLPIKWKGNNFSKYLSNLFDKYKSNCSRILEENYYKDIKFVCDKILEVVDKYLLGLPSIAFKEFDTLMDFYYKNTELKIYKKCTNQFPYDDKLELFRMAIVDDNNVYPRSRIFHVPYTLREKIDSSRYSIAGFPSLYLGTSLELCSREIRYRKNKFAIASRFKINREIRQTEVDIEVIELAIKPSDFNLSIDKSSKNYDVRKNLLILADLGRENIKYYKSNREFDEINLNNDEVRANYIIWYPLIAACSCIRQFKKDCFTVEYIVPQMLMQWIRLKEKEYNKNERIQKLIAIRYFSCESKRASDLGFNYVFPSSGIWYNEQPFCDYLARCFRLTAPIHVDTFNTINECMSELLKDNNFDHI